MTSRSLPQSQNHKVERYYVRCSCGMTVESLRTAPDMTLKEFTLWLETFLCKHEALSSPSPGEMK